MLNRWEISEKEKVCGLDIDGVLNFYPDPWVEFLNERLNASFPDLKAVKASVPYQLYKDIKYEYRESGIKENLEVRPGAAELTSILKSLGYTIMILTARPFSKHKTLFKQTANWLTKNGIKYDGIIFGEDKYIQILQYVPNLRFMVEDHRYYANLIGRWGYPVFLVDNIYNQGELDKNVHRVKDLEEVIRYVREI